MTWSEWKENGGNGLSAWSTHFVCKTWGPESQWGPRTLEEIMDSAPCVRRELERNMQRKKEEIE